MQITLRAFGGCDDALLDLNAQTKVSEVVAQAYSAFGARPEDIIELYYLGRLLTTDNEAQLINYKVKDGDVINVRIKKKIIPTVKKEVEKAAKKQIEQFEPKSVYFNVGDSLYYQDERRGQWHEATLTRISANQQTEGKENVKNLIFHILDGVSGEELELTLDRLRPCSHVQFSPADLQPSMEILAFTNLKRNHELGWHHVELTKVEAGRFGRMKCSGTVVLSAEEKYENRLIQYYYRTFNFPRLMPREEWSQAGCNLAITEPCRTCLDNPSKKCKRCSCIVCGGKNNEEMQIICEECDDTYHTTCLSKPIANLSEIEEWYCPKCSNAEESKNESPGMQFTRSKEHTLVLVSRDHFGPIPGVPCGRLFASRTELSRLAVHAPMVSDVCSTANIGVRSICFSGGCDGDKDRGHQIIFSSSAGQKPKLAGQNLALAQSCNAKISQRGAVARQWQKGTPIRLVRTFQLGKISKFAPEIGYRYDGIYKVSKYYLEEKRGSKVWRFVLRRDDPQPPPWTSAGMALMRSLSVGHLEGVPERDEMVLLKKRKLPFEGVPSVSRARVRYDLPPSVSALVREDQLNHRNWENLQAAQDLGYPDFINAVGETFSCIICQEILKEPFTMVCGHNACLPCIRKWLRSSGKANCPCCNGIVDVPSVEVNKVLEKILKVLIPPSCMPLKQLTMDANQ